MEEEQDYTEIKILGVEKEVDEISSMFIPENLKKKNKDPWIKPTIKIKSVKRKTRFPLVTKTTAIDRKHPTWLCYKNEDPSFADQLAYYSNRYATTIFQKQASFYKMHKNKLGIYHNSYGVEASKNYQSSSLKGIHSVRMSYDGSHLALGTGAGVIKVFCEYFGETLKISLKGPQDIIRSIRFHPKHMNIFFAGGASGIVYLGHHIKRWIIFKWIHEVRTEINVIDLTSSGDFLASAGKDGAIRIYDVQKYEESGGK